MLSGLLFSFAISVEMLMTDGSSTSRKIDVAENNGVSRLTIPAAAIGSGVREVSVLPDFAVAHEGADGYWVLPDNTLGMYNHATNAVRVLGASQMSFWGMKTPDRTFVTRVAGLSWDYVVKVRSQDGVYTVSTVFVLGGRRPSEDVELEWTFLPKGSEYPQMAKSYRDWQLKTGRVSMLEERAKHSPELRKAAESIEVRIRHAWKPAPPSVHEQTVANEPSMHVAVSFKRARQFVDACRVRGIGKAEFCLVGWNRMGHDGRYPQVFPVEPALGGEVELRKLINGAKEHGYLIVAHDNHSDAYSVAECWSADDIIRDHRGLLSSNACWSGGRMYNLCPKVAWEKYAQKDLKHIAELGFRGLHYTDVQSILPPRECWHASHPLSRREAASYLGLIAAEARKQVGGFASEGGFDHHIGNLDYALYVSFAYPRGSSFANKDGRLPPLTNRMIPLWQLVYHGIVLSNPFSACCNYTIKDPDKRLTLVEYGGRPMFYVHSSFVTGLNWMGAEDLSLSNDVELERTVSAIKRGADEYEQLSDLQYHLMTDHRELAHDVTMTVFGNGTKIIVNHTSSPFHYGDDKIPPLQWRRYDNLDVR